MNFTLAYTRLCRREKAKNKAEGILTTKAYNTRHFGDRQVHHILPKTLGGKNVDTNYVLLDPMTHAYAHLLLNLALLQEGKTEQLQRLGYPCNGKLVHFAMAKSALRSVKIAVYVAGKRHSPIMLSLKDAAKHFCFISHKDFTDQSTLEDAMANALNRAIFGTSKFGMKTKVVFKPFKPHLA